MSSRRSRLEMYLDVLEEISRGVGKPTNIMYRCNLSWRPLQEILRSLIEKELIEENELDGRKYYKVTEKGERILIYLRRVIQMLHHAINGETKIPKRKQELLMAETSGA